MKPFLSPIWQMAARFVPEQIRNDPESERKARLISRFGLLGSVFGLAYACFYLCIRHYWGVGIIVLCSVGVAMTPAIMLRTVSTILPSHFLLFILLAGFSSLCCVEGGLHGHAIAWLVSIPLCAMLLVGRSAAKWWTLWSILAALGIAGADLAGIPLAVTYNPQWHSLISTAGYAGLILFMIILGTVFESGRERAHQRMADALSALAKSNEQLVRLNQEKNEFMGIAAHDLKNPLTAIIGRAELLSLTKDPERVKQAAEMIVAAGTRMRDLITNLLDANAIEEGTFAPKLVRCDLSEIARDCVQHNAAAAMKKGMSVEVRLQEGLWVEADPALTMQIVDNLVSNALKYSPPGCSIFVSSALEGGQATFSVKDSGPGISAAEQSKLFRRFSRLSARPTGGECSTGLGLSIAKRLAEVMRATIHCQSEVGSGSTFSLRFAALAMA